MTIAANGFPAWNSIPQKISAEILLFYNANARERIIVKGESLTKQSAVSFPRKLGSLIQE